MITQAFMKLFLRHNFGIINFVLLPDRKLVFLEIESQFILDGRSRSSKRTVSCLFGCATAA